MVGDVRVVYEVTASTLPLLQQAKAVFIREFHAAEVAAVNARRLRSDARAGR